MRSISAAASKSGASGRPLTRARSAASRPGSSSASAFNQVTTGSLRHRERSLVSATIRRRFVSRTFAGLGREKSGRSGQASSGRSPTSKERVGAPARLAGAHQHQPDVLQHRLVAQRRTPRRHGRWRRRASRPGGTRRRSPATSAPRPAITGALLARSRRAARATASSNSASDIGIEKANSASPAERLGSRRLIRCVCSLVVFDVGEALVSARRSLQRAALRAGLPLDDLLDLLRELRNPCR